MDKKRTNTDMIKSTKSEADTLKNDEDHRFQINFTVCMNEINSHARIFYQDLFATVDGGAHKVDICDDNAIDIIYTDVVKNNVAKVVAQYPQSERRYLWNLYDKGRNSNEFHRALYFKNADRNIIIDRKKKKYFNINRSIYEFSNVIDNGGSSIVFDFDKLLVNMVINDDKMYDKICAIWDGDETDTTSNHVENETEILSEVNDVIDDDSIVISEDNKSDIATTGEDGFVSHPEAGYDEPCINLPIVVYSGL